MPDSEVVISAGATTFAGPDAVGLFAARRLQAALGMYARSGMLTTSTATLGGMLRAASRYTAKSYRRSRKGAAAASADVRAWADAMAAGMPITDNRKEAT